VNSATLYRNKIIEIKCRAVGLNQHSCTACACCTVLSHVRYGAVQCSWLTHYVTLKRYTHTYTHALTYRHTHAHIYSNLSVKETVKYTSHNTHIFPSYPPPRAHRTMRHSALNPPLSLPLSLPLWDPRSLPPPFSAHLHSQSLKERRKLMVW
jgi:hypothetical protein